MENLRSSCSNKKVSVLPPLINAVLDSEFCTAVRIVMLSLSDMILVCDSGARLPPGLLSSGQPMSDSDWTAHC